MNGGGYPASKISNVNQFGTFFCNAVRRIT